MGPIPMERVFTSGSYGKLYLLNGSHFVIHEIISGSHLLIRYSGSIYLMSRTVKSGSHSNGTSFYKWVLWKIILTKWVPFRNPRNYKWVPFDDSLQWVHLSHE